MSVREVRLPGLRVQVDAEADLFAMGLDARTWVEKLIAVMEEGARLETELTLGPFLDGPAAVQASAGQMGEAAAPPAFPPPLGPVPGRARERVRERTTTPDQLQCQHCPQTFKSSQARAAHERAHVRARCGFCDREFSAAGLNAHLQACKVKAALEAAGDEPADPMPENMPPEPEPEPAAAEEPVDVPVTPRPSWKDLQEEHAARMRKASQMPPELGRVAVAEPQKVAAAPDDIPECGDAECDRWPARSDSGLCEKHHLLARRAGVPA
jgi:hypothetical protein